MQSWFGLSDVDTEGRYLWTDGTSTVFMNWSSGQPDNGGDSEDCGEFAHGSMGTWNDRPCSLEQAFVCKK